MDIYTIDKEDHFRVLRQKAEPINNMDESTARLAEQMIDTMIKGNGIGIAGPQVGLLQRIFTVKLPHEDPLVFINPEITATSSELSRYEEGCLSIPGQYGHVDRPASIQVQAWNLRQRPFTLEAGDLLATVIQHELDHLNGVLFIDYLEERARQGILRKFGINTSKNQ